MTARFDRKIVLVTGASSGIGRATALAFARAGATVVVAGRNAEGLAQTVNQIEANGGNATPVIADVSSSRDVAMLVETTVQRHDGLHIAVNNAGIVGAPGPTADLDEEIWSAVLATNLTGVWLCMKHEITYMRQHGGGVIVNMASNIGAHGRRAGMAAYAASKAAVSALTQTAARDHIGDDIRINAVSPGATDTSMSRRPGETDADRDTRSKAVVPIGRVGSTQEIANAVLWLASDEASFTVGHDLVVDGGATA